MEKVANKGEFHLTLGQKKGMMYLYEHITETL